MKLAMRVFYLALAIGAGLSLSGCAGNGCPNLNLSSSSGNGAGTPGGVAKGGGACGVSSAGVGGGTNAGGASALVYHITSTVALGAVGRNNTGSLAPISPFTSPTLAGSGADDMTIVSGKFLYIPQSGTNNVEAFLINRGSGSLTAIPGSPYPVPSGADTVATDPKGRFLFVGSEGSGGIATFEIDASTGALTASPNATGTSFGISSADVFTVDGTGKFLYVGEQGFTSFVHGFSIDQTTGAITPLATSPFSLGIATPRADPSGKFLLGIVGFADGSSTDSHIHVFAIDPNTGTPTEIANSPFATSAPALDFAISPNGKFVYTFDTTGTAAAPMEGFQLDTTTGNLTSLPGSPFTTVPAVGECKFEQSGSNLICTDAFVGTKFMVIGTNTSTGAVTHTGTDLSTSTSPFAVTD